MTEGQAKEHLRETLQSFTPGSILHLLSDLFSESAQRTADDTARAQAEEVAATLFVVGLGIDAVYPRSFVP